MTMHKIKNAPSMLFGALVLMFVAQTYLPVQSAWAQRIERSFDVAPDKRLDVNLDTGGTITIRGWDRNEVAITLDRRGRDADEVEVDIDERSSGIYIRTEYFGRTFRGDVDLDVNVPHRFNLDIQTMGGGITIEGVEGVLEGQTMGGELQLTDLKGEVDLSTMGGAITLENSEVDGKVHTMGGEVYIADVTGNVKGTTMGGEVTYRNVKASSSSRHDQEVRINSMGGDINVDDASAGADVETMGGDIRIRSAAGHVKATTMGGTIEVDALDGWIEANTMGGDMEVRMVGNASSGDRHVELVSMGGDIELVVPPGLSMDVDIELAFTRRYAGDYRIISDFDLDIEETDRWEYDNGSPRKYLYGTGQIGGGRHHIKLKTVNGNIYLKRGR